MGVKMLSDLFKSQIQILIICNIANKDKNKKFILNNKIEFATYEAKKL